MLAALADSTDNFPFGAGSMFNVIMVAASDISTEGKLALFSNLAVIVGRRPEGPEKADALFAMAREVPHMKSASEFSCPSQIGVALMVLPDCPEKTKMFETIF